MTEEKIETKLTSVRLPLDVLDLLNRWSEETGQSVAGCITTIVRTAAEDEKRITNVAKVPESVLHETESGARVLQLREPKNRDQLADAIWTIIHETSDRIGERDQISALGVARARVYKSTPEFQTALLERQRRCITGPYDDEKALADRLSASDAAD